jgi:outer membrane lipoprotein-sorting protein
MRKWILGLVCLLLSVQSASADDAAKLFYALRTKVMAVRDYTADVKMKIDVNYMHIPQLKGTLYFKSPNKMRLERHGGISILPKKNINLTLSNLIPTGNVTVIDAGTDVKNGRKVRVLKVIPEDDLSNIVLTKLYVDEADLLAVRTETTTRNDGTVLMDLEFGHYATYGLPDKVTIFMDLKDYKLPKGVTMDYNDEAETTSKPKKVKSQKGTIQISYLKYAVNTGLSDDVFVK